jgi:hypothetical protein
MKIKLYRAILLILVLLLVAALIACAGSNDKTGRTDASAPSGQWKESRPMRLLLGHSQARDSAAIITDFYVDQALRQAADSIPAAEYLTLNYRDSLANIAVSGGKQGVPFDELGEKLKLDGIVVTKFARFSSVLGVDMRIVDPKTQKDLFHVTEFSMIRYRDSSGAMLLGPAIYDAVRKGLGRFFGMPHTPAAPVATEPLIMASVVMVQNPKLGRLATQRDRLSYLGVGALGEYGRSAYPELVAFDITSRNQVLSMVNVGGVADYLPMNDLERRALFNLGIDRYVTAIVTPITGDSAQIRVEIRSVVSPARDTLIDAEQIAVPVGMFATTKIEEDFVRTLLQAAEPLFTRETERIRAAYEHESAGTVSAGEVR